MPLKKLKEKFYLGNSNLPTAQTEYDYTPQMIKEIAKCRKNILHFASNYFYRTTMKKIQKKQIFILFDYPNKTHLIQNIYYSRREQWFCYG